MATITSDPTSAARSLQLSDLRELMAEQTPPCVSIHVQTAQQPDQGNQIRIRFKNALAEAERSLLQGHDHGEVRALLEPLHNVEAHQGPFRGMRQGLSVFRSADRLIVRPSPFEVPDFTVVADSFHVKPFVRAMQHARPYWLLCVTSDRVALYVGDRYHLEEVPLDAEVPADMGEALGPPSRVTKTKRAIQDPADSDQRDSQLSRYFRRVDEAIRRHHVPADSDLPLMLAALPEYQSRFREASHNPALIEEGIRRDPFKGVTIEELTRLAAEAYQPVWDRRVQAFKQRYGEARSHGQGSDRLEEVARQAAFGKIETVAIRHGYRLGGRIDPATGDMTRKPLDNPAVDDVTDDIAEATLRTGGEVMVLEEDHMPTDSPVAAIFRK